MTGSLLPLLLLFHLAVPLEGSVPLYERTTVRSLSQGNPDIQAALIERLSPEQLLLLQSLNRRSLKYFQASDSILVPRNWKRPFLSHAPFPQFLADARKLPQLLVVDLAIQAFGAYQDGALVRWGAIASGRKSMATPTGAYQLIFRQRLRISSFNETWRMEWYFNFDNVVGNAFHAGFFSGLPTSHGCVRLHLPDALWLYEWGRERRVDPETQSFLQAGTPVIIQNAFDFEQRPLWLNPRSRILPRSEMRLPRALLKTLGIQARAQSKKGLRGVPLSEVIPPQTDTASR